MFSLRYRRIAVSKLENVIKRTLHEASTSLVGIFPELFDY